MSEYVVEVEYDTLSGAFYHTRREEIVRCRDCEHYYDSINGCAEFGDESRGEFANVEPDGYCAWGERRDA